MHYAIYCYRKEHPYEFLDEAKAIIGIFESFSYLSLVSFSFLLDIEND
jgi:hypothetical protein